MRSTPQTTMIRAVLTLGLLVLAAALGSASIALAQRGPGMGARMYDPSTVETVRGVVTTVDTVTSTRRRQHRGVHLQLETAEGDVLTVHLGPLFYLQQQNVNLEVGDEIAVRGSRVTLRNAPALIAAEVQARGQSWTLRDDLGRPRWRGQGRDASSNR